MKYESINKYCSLDCKIEADDYKRINKVSAKRDPEQAIYRELREDFLSRPRNATCPITGRPATTIHHMAKRIGYADQYAVDNDISLFLDVRYWLGVSMEGHEYIENNPEWAEKHGYSIRLRFLKNK